MSSLDDLFKPKFSRSRTGCLCCRRGKHKCDEEKPVCRRCRLANRECVYPIATSSQARRVNKPVKRRASSQADRFEELSEDNRVATRANTATGTVVTGTPVTPTLGNIISSPSDYLTTIVPDPRERDLILHLLCFGTVVMHALPTPDQPIAFLDTTQCLHNPRGTSIEIDSLLLSLMSIAAIHQSSLHLQQSNKYLTSPPVGRYGPPTARLNLAAGADSRMRAIGEQFSSTSLALCSTALAFKLDGGPGDKEVSDTLLASSICIIISQSLMAGNRWKEAFDIALQLVELRGGAAAMLTESTQVSSSAVTRTRMLLELLVIVDVCHCLASGARPRVLTEPFGPWWFDYTPINQPWPNSAPDSIQYIYGMDRGILELVNKVNMVVHENIILGPLPDQVYFAIHQQKVQDLLLELEIWENNLDARQEHPRVKLGNTIMVHILRIIFHVDLFHQSHSHPDVQLAAHAALELIDQSRGGGFIIGLLLPTIIAGSMMIDEEGRELARKVLTGVRSTTAFAYDIEEALKSLNKLHALRNEGHLDPSWRQVTSSGPLLF
ncbi:hypothetical protein IAT38_006202 [Cryptococcus sp. DSM 104549]